MSLPMNAWADEASVYDRLHVSQRDSLEQIPAALALIGRDEERARLQTLVTSPEVRLLTVVGPPGAGKTRLAVDLVESLLHTPEERRPSIHFVALAPLTDSALVLPTIARSLGIRRVAARSARSRLADYFEGRPALLILDTCEHVSEAAVDVVELLEACPSVKVLATSREPLNVYGEQRFELGPLAVPDLEALPSTEELGRIAAVRLLVDRACRVKPDFGLTDDNAACVAQLCVGLDGLPLAVELAAARLAIFTPCALIARMDRPLPLLVDGPRDRPARQQTLRATIAWSYDLLTQAERAIFRRCAVFAGGWTLEAAEAICPAEPSETAMVLNCLPSLVEKHLVLSTPQADGNQRFSMLELVRDYAADQLRASHEDGACEERHRAYYVTLAEHLTQELRGSGSEQCKLLDQLEVELNNLRAVHTRTAANGDIDTLMRLAGGALYPLWTNRGYRREGQHWAALALARSAGTRSKARSTALVFAAALARELGDIEVSIARLEEGLAYERELGSPDGISITLTELGSTLCIAGEYERAASLLDEALGIKRSLKSSWAIANTLRHRAAVAIEQGNYEQVVSFASEALKLFRGCGEMRGVARVLNILGIAARQRGALDEALLHHEESVALSRAINHRPTAASLRGLGRAELLRGDVAPAVMHIRESLTLAHEAESEPEFVAGLEAMADALVARGLPEVAARLCGAAEAMRESMPAPVPLVDRRRHAAVVDELRIVLRDKYRPLWREGRELQERIVARLDGLMPRDPCPPTAEGQSSASLLTAREWQVAALVTRGLTNEQIAQRLCISRRTAGAHLEHIYGKLGLRSRVDICRWIATHEPPVDLEVCGTASAADD